MAIKSVLKMGEMSLLERSEAVTVFDSPRLLSLLADMEDTMVATNGAGIAAPQIGVNLRVVIFGYDKNSRYPKEPAIPRTVLINPVITPIGEAMELGWEGCLSVPGMRGLVPRLTHVRYCGFDQFGVAIEREVSGFHARVVQHECDHLEGVLYPQRIENMQFFGYSDVLEANDYLAHWPRE